VVVYKRFSSSLLGIETRSKFVRDDAVGVGEAEVTVTEVLRLGYKLIMLYTTTSKAITPNTPAAMILFLSAGLLPSKIFIASY
jgi:hypothetical protein